MPLDSASALDADSPTTTLADVRGMMFEVVQQCAAEKLRLVRDSEALDRLYTELMADKTDRLPDELRAV